ncbi:MAG: CPBP family glutamic-type intramembrane protease [Candidatus Micrarchaeia archaeon]
MVACSYDSELFSNVLFLLLSQIKAFLPFLFIYLGVFIYNKKIIQITAERYFRLNFDSFKNTILIPVGAGVVMALIFNFLRLTFFPVESTPSVIYLSALIFNGVIVAPILESIADQGLVFLTMLSVFVYLQNNAKRKTSVLTPSKSILIIAILIQAFVFGISHYSDEPSLSNFLAFKAAYTTIFAIILGVICWLNDRNLLPVMICHASYNVILILSQTFIPC